MATSADAPTAMDGVTLAEGGCSNETSPVKADESLVTEVQKTLASAGSVVDSKRQEGAESSCSAGGSSSSAETDTEKTLEQATELMDKGSKALKVGDYTEATDCFSRAVEIRVAHYGELAPECVGAYYKYGCALLYKAQEEADPLGMMPKKEFDSLKITNKDGTTMTANDGESSTTPAAVKESKHDEVSTLNEEEQVNGGGDNDQEEDGDGESEDEDVAEDDEDESDLDLAWKTLDVARAIVEKHPDDTMEKVDILSALAEVALEREDTETSVSDYLKALSILERLVEPDNRQIAELNFRICLCLEVGSKAQEAIPYCQKAISVCKARLERLIDEVNELKRETPVGENGPGSAGPEAEPSTTCGVSISDKESEIGTLKELLCELERKLEDLRQLGLAPPSALSDVLKMISVKAMGNQKMASSSSQMGGLQGYGGFDSPTSSTGHTKNVTDLGVVGRGVKRPPNPDKAEPHPLKKASKDSSEEKGGVDPIPMQKPSLESSGEK